ncbi:MULTISPECIES: mechanosensitive ion channel domain-containing protein [unclassified Sphingomonas]|uniref:mechanosensitive ion channel family protein n=1 Tax=Novosphingobium rhizosphaerae TaxID=1551649 RepID=UPI0015CD8828
MSWMSRKAHHQVNDFLQSLDDLGFDIGHYHISVFNAAKMVLVVVAMFMLARLGSKLARYFFARATSLDSTQQVLGEKIVSLMVWALAFFMGIDLLGINFTALTVFSGAFGLAIGFGLQKTFGNLIAGLILLMDRSIKPGDVIAINDGKGNTVGQVRKIGIRAVSVATRDHREYLIPNEILMTTQVENWSYSNTQIVLTIPISVAYGTDIDLAEKLMLEAARAAPRVLPEPGPSVVVTALGVNGIEMAIYVTIEDPEEGTANVRSQVLRALWRLFQQHDVEVPFPQSDVRLRDTAALRALLEPAPPLQPDAAHGPQ